MRDRFLKVIVSFGILLLELFYTLPSQAETDQTDSGTYGIVWVRLFDRPGIQRYVEVQLTDFLHRDRLNATLAIPNVEVRLKPSDRVLNQTSPPEAPPGYGRKRIRIFLDTKDSIPSSDKRFEVAFKTLYFADPKTSLIVEKQSVTSSANLMTIEELIAEARSRLEEAVKQAKTAEEKDIFAGFNVAKGEGQPSDGNADFHLNRTLYAVGIGQAALLDHASMALHIKKSSATLADPKEFDLGLTFRKTFLRLRGSELDQIMKGAQNPGTPDAEQANKLLAKHNKDFWRAFYVDETLRLEGQAFTFNVTNFVSDTQLQIATVTKNLGRTGYWNLRLVPAGLELGRNLRAVNNRVTEEMIFRTKFGAALTVFYAPAEPENALIKRITMNLRGVGRYLFENETAFDEQMKEMPIGKGPRRWYEGDVKIFFVENSKSRVGFRLSFTRGSLPPAFAFTKSFQYGLVFETSDDTTSEK